MSPDGLVTWQQHTRLAKCPPPGQEALKAPIAVHTGLGDPVRIIPRRHSGPSRLLQSSRCIGGRNKMQIEQTATAVGHKQEGDRKKPSSGESPEITTTSNGDGRPRPIKGGGRPPRRGSLPLGKPSQPSPTRGIYYSAVQGESSSQMAAHGEAEDDVDDDGRSDNNDEDDADQEVEAFEVEEELAEYAQQQSADAATASSSAAPTRNEPSPETKRLLLIKYNRGKDLPRSQYRGVSWDRRMDMWRVKVNAVHIGFFKDEKEAAIAYDNAKLSVFKGGGPLEVNFPELVKDLPFPDVEVKRAIVKSDPFSFELIERERAMAEGNNSGSKVPRPSRYRGVMWDIGTKSWRAKIKVKARTWYLGVFDDEVEAAHAYDSAAAYMGRDKSTLNFPETDFSKTQLSRPAPSWVMQHLEETTREGGNRSTDAPGTVPQPSELSGTERKKRKANKSTSIKPSRSADTTATAPKRESLRASDTVLVYDESNAPATTNEGEGESDDQGEIREVSNASNMPQKNQARTIGQSSSMPATTTTANRPNTAAADSTTAARSTSHNSALASNKGSSNTMGNIPLPIKEGFILPLRMRGVAPDPQSPSYFISRLEYFQHSLYLGRYSNAEEACLAHDIACLRLLGAHTCREQELLNCRSSVVSMLLKMRVPTPLDILSRALCQAVPPSAEFVTDHTRAVNARFRVNETKERLQEVRDKYKRRRTSWTRPGRSNYDHASSVHDDDGSFDENDDVNYDDEDDEEEEDASEDEQQEHRTSLAERVRQADEKIRKAYMVAGRRPYTFTSSVQSMPTTTSRTLSASSSETDKVSASIAPRDLGKIPLLELAKRVVLEASRNRL